MIYAYVKEFLTKNYVGIICQNGKFHSISAKEIINY